ncbi:MAG: NRDE family protein [Flavobacteriaceae bacterium]|nr:NRDE family protein [Flavobacteriaceae bacterium]
MCTVSFVKSNNNIIITSNRDENINRKQAFTPKKYILNGKKVFFPKDPEAGGTWFAVNQYNSIVVLLNGASKSHQKKASYSRSRGLIVLDIISSDNTLTKWESINLDNIEPFTLVALYDYKLYQLRWDGEEKEAVSLDENSDHIWSSATLYTSETIKEREILFDGFLKKNKNISGDDMISFHTETKKGDKENGLLINRDNKMITQSVTQVVLNSYELLLKYKDLINNDTFSQTIKI